MNEISGIPAAPGIASGPARWFLRPAVQVRAQPSIDQNHEIQRLESALEQAATELVTLERRAEAKIGKEKARIFSAQRMILQDPELVGRVKKSIETEATTVESAWQDGIRHYAEMLRGLGDEYLAARAADVEDVGTRVLGLLSGELDAVPELGAPSVILADELTPTDTILLDRQTVLAFCTKGGGPTSHVAILSRALGVPCIVGLGSELALVADGTMLLVDGGAGRLLVQPDASVQADYLAKAEQLAKAHRDALMGASRPATTSDGRRIEVCANISSVAEAVAAIRLGADGVGLLRTEFLFLDRETAPDEEEQVQAYSRIFGAIGSSKPIVVRTLDIGGDKPAGYMPAPRENNPFLGLRGLRLSLRFQTLFETQLRSLLRAGRGYELRIMFPMVSTVEEFLQARTVVARCRQALTEAGQAHNEQTPLGIMVEVPSAALMAEAFARHVDFFSIGTNDLSQYTLAAERTSVEVAYLADAFHPAVLRLIDEVIRAAHAEGKWVGLCGELAGDPLASAVLVGLGLDEFSASARSIPVLKETIRRLHAGHATSIARAALELPNAKEVRSYLQIDR